MVHVFLTKELAQVVLGGNCLNACIVTSRLGVPAVLATKLGDDYLGAQILDCCKKEAVRTDAVVIKKGAHLLSERRC